MEFRVNVEISPRQHIANIFEDFITSRTRLLESFTNLSNTVIDTALNGQNKFIFEIVQNADDAFSDQFTDITLQFTLQDGYFIVQHNGKGFDFNDVERICDYASQIKDVKANDLNKTGYKGLGFKSLFNLTNCIYIYSGGYSFRFDKTYWSDPDRTPWQIIPIWNEHLPLSEKYNYIESVNFILKVQNAKQLEKHLREIIDHPEYFLYLRHVNNFRINLFGEEHFLERKVDYYSVFIKHNLYRNRSVVSTWLSRVFESEIPDYVQNIVQKGSKFTYPDKIKEATQIPIVFTIKIDETMREVMKIRNSLCFNTLPTQLQLTLPYHINSFFILNLDRTQMDENDFNEFIFKRLGYLQLVFLNDLAKVPHLKNFVAELYVQKINHRYIKFNKAFLDGLLCAKNEIKWLPAHGGLHLLKLNEAWIDEIEFFKQNFRNIRDEISRKIISYDVIKQHLLPTEVKRFTYDELFQRFPNVYHPQLTDDSYVEFISYLHKRLKTVTGTSIVIRKLRSVVFLRTKSGILSSPENALLEEINNPIHDSFELNPVNNEYLPQIDSGVIRDWLLFLGVKRLRTPVDILRESLLKWIECDILDLKITLRNHIFIIDYLSENSESLIKEERKNLKKKLLVLTESKEFKLMKNCYLPEAFPIEELKDAVSNDKKICSVYNMANLRNLLCRLSICKKITPYNLLRKSILEWIKNNEIVFKLNTKNYAPITDYFGSRYSEIENKLTEDEKSELKKMPVLTCDGVFQKAEFCYFDFAFPDVTEFQNAISKKNLVCSKSISKNSRAFLSKIGVTETIKPVDILRKSIFKWIEGGTIESEINLENHQRILTYIATKWEAFILPELKQHERKYFREFPLLTKSNRFKKACQCYWQTNSKDIPNVDSIIFPDDLVSSEYNSTKIKKLLGNELFGIRSLTFEFIWEKYCHHLISLENNDWFFFHLCYYWESSSITKYYILNNIKLELSRSHILAKNGRRYLPTELYSFRFLDIYIIDPNSLPILECNRELPPGLEEFLGFKTELEMPCIMNLIKAFDRKQNEKNIGEQETAAFFKTLLEQLRNKNIKEIRKYTLKLLSKLNKLTPAEDLHYFEEESAECTLDKCYLKRIDKMSHNDTLELAKLCNVNILPFQKTVTFKKEKYVTTLKEFYLERLPLITLKEAKERNNPSLKTLKMLYDFISLLELFECEEICAKYPFGGEVKEPIHFHETKIYVSSEWENQRSTIHTYIKNKLRVKADIGNILDMKSVSEDAKKKFLQFQSEDPNAIIELYRLEKELKNISSEHENVGADVEKVFDFLPILKNDVLSPLQQNIDIDSRQEQTAYNHTFEQISKQETDPAFNFKSKENISDSSLHNLNADFMQEQTPYGSTQTECVKQDKRIFDEQPLDSKSNENAINSQLQKSYVESEQERSLKEFYVQRLPFIVIRESKKLNESPYKILKRLYDKVISIEVIPFKCINKKGSVNCFVNPQCFFRGLKIYIPGKWTDYETEVHQHIIKELCLNCNVTDTTDMESMKENFKEWISLGNDSQLFNLLEEKLRKLYQEQIEQDERNETREIRGEREKNYSTLSNRISDEIPFEKPPEKNDRQYSVNDGIRSRISVRNSGEKEIPEFEGIFKTDLSDESTILAVCSKEPQWRKLSEQNSHGSPREKPWVKFSSVNPEHKFQIQRLNESRIFTFLQDYYKRKYPKARCSLSDDRFVLQLQLHRFEIIWLNKCKDKELPYDFIFKKDGENKKIIEVQSSNKVVVDSFNINDHIYIDRNKLMSKQQQFKEKYCIYYVSNTEDSMQTENEGNDLPALYKIVPLKFSVI